jgi:hypothetical protein
MQWSTSVSLSRGYPTGDFGSTKIPRSLMSLFLFITIHLTASNQRMLATAIPNTLWFEPLKGMVMKRQDQ